MQIKKVVHIAGLYYLCSKNKDADQLCGYRTADLHLCYRIFKNRVFPMILLTLYTLDGFFSSASLSMIGSEV